MGRCGLVPLFAIVPVSVNQNHTWWVWYYLVLNNFMILKAISNYNWVEFPRLGCSASFLLKFMISQW